jgi:hypothetical protein
MRRAFYLLLLLSTTPLLAQDAKLAEQLNREAGIEITFRTPKPPIAKLNFNVVGQGDLKERKLIRYSISVSGLSKKGPYYLMTWDIGTEAPIIAIQHIAVHEKGTLRCGEKRDDCPGASPNSDLVVGLSGMIGQPRRFILTGEDKLPIAMGEVVPFPASGNGGECSIEAVLLRPNGAIALIEGKGFLPSETVKFMSSSPYREALESDKKADQAGNVLTVVLPFVKGHEEGTTSVTLTNSKCHPTTTFNWGAYREVGVQPVSN